MISLLEDSLHEYERDDGLDRVEEYKKKLENQSLEMFMALSPGVRLRALMKQECNKQDKSTPNSKKKKVLPTKTRDSQARDQEKQDTAKWNAIYNIFEQKRKEYHQQWKDYVISKSQQSRERFETLQAHRTIPVRKLKPSSFERVKIDYDLFMKPLKIRPETTNDKISLEQVPLATKTAEGTIALPEERMTVRKPIKKVFTFEKQEMPTLRPLSIDDYSKNNPRNYWVPSKTTLPKEVETRINKTIHMCNNILKFKKNTTTYLEKGKWDGTLTDSFSETTGYSRSNSVTGDSNQPSIPKLNESESKRSSFSSKQWSPIDAEEMGLSLLSMEFKLPNLHIPVQECEETAEAAPNEDENDVQTIPVDDSTKVDQVITLTIPKLEPIEPKPTPKAIDQSPLTYQSLCAQPGIKFIKLKPGKIRYWKPITAI